MNTAAFAETIIRSLVIGGLAVACVAICPAAWRVRVRRAVPVITFLALLALAAGIFRPLPKVEISSPLPGALSEWAAWTPGGWAAALWAVGAAVCLLRLAAGAISVGALLRSTEPVPGRAWRQLLTECMKTLGLRGSVRLRLAGPGFVPSATGLFRRTILLPDEARAWTREQRRIVLLHELGHFRRGDLWTHALGRVACALHWFNPFAWMLQRHLCIEREFACDELVIERGAAPGDYAAVLWEMASAMRRRPASAAAFLAMAAPQPGPLEQRVRRILAPAGKKRRWLRIADALLCASLAAGLIFCTACKPVSRVLGSGAWSAGEIEARLLADPFPANR